MTNWTLKIDKLKIELIIRGNLFWLQKASFVPLGHWDISRVQLFAHLGDNQNWSVWTRENHFDLRLFKEEEKNFDLGVSPKQPSILILMVHDKGNVTSSSAMRRRESNF